MACFDRSLDAPDHEHTALDLALPAGFVGRRLALLLVWILGRGGRHDVSVRLRDYIGPAMCALGAVCMLAALAVDIDSTAAKALMAASAILFLPGAFVTLAVVRRIAGPPN
jgi:hypothetical protein